GTTAVSSGFTNSTAGAVNYPVVMAMWDDMSTGTDGDVSYLVTGSGSSHKLTIQWRVRNLGESDGFNKTIQVWLFEGSNRIEIVYGDKTGANTLSASVGIAASGTDYNDVNTSTNNNDIVSPEDLNTVWPGSGRAYIFDAPSVSGATFSWLPTDFLDDPSAQE